MRVRLGLNLFFTILLAGSTIVGQDQVFRDNRLFRAGIGITSITATVRDDQGRLVTDLGRDAFEVYEDGEAQTVTQFTNDGVPTTLAALLDPRNSVFRLRCPCRVSPDVREALSAARRDSHYL